MSSTLSRFLFLFLTISKFLYSIFHSFHLISGLFITSAWKTYSLSQFNCPFYLYLYWASQVVLMVKNPPANAEDERCGFHHWSAKSPGVGNGNPLQYFCLQNSTDREVRQVQSMGPQRVRHNWAHTYARECGGGESQNQLLSAFLIRLQILVGPPFTFSCFNLNFLYSSQIFGPMVLSLIWRDE